MKIGIITNWCSLDNYGQQLQCWALQRYLKRLGHEPYLIKYLPQSPQWKKRVTYIWNRLFTSPQKKKAQLEEALVWIKNAEDNKQRKFEDFRKKNINSTDITYYNISELRANPPIADMYITGSDQVWNDSLKNPNTAGNYLDFTPPRNVKRVSYAASIGRNIEDREIKKFKQYLSHFDAISLREQNACDFCHSLGFHNAMVTIDPTLLLNAEEYDAIDSSQDRNDSFDMPYVFVYLLNIRTSDDIYWNEFNRQISSEGLQVKVVASSGYLPARDFLPGLTNTLASIPEWLSLVKNAEYVITTSFHGIVFCLLYHRPFYAVLLNNEYAKANTRISSLLSTVGLEKRIVSSAADIKLCKNSSIDWVLVDEKLAQLRSNSVDFLNKALASD